MCLQVFYVLFLFSFLHFNCVASVLNSVGNRGCYSNFHEILCVESWSVSAPRERERDPYSI